mmetsp:Transcript_2639/g.6521  ORF Transcript_2639/g.6521 Transcript_2639/m.6521 type:complete len:308 (-) Transcript_2639:243-1166(-)
MPASARESSHWRRPERGQRVEMRSCPSMACRRFISTGRRTRRKSCPMRLSGVPCLQLWRMKSVESHRLYTKCVAREHCSIRTSCSSGARCRSPPTSSGPPPPAACEARSIAVHMASMRVRRVTSSLWASALRRSLMCSGSDATHIWRGTLSTLTSSSSRTSFGWKSGSFALDAVREIGSLDDAAEGARTTLSFPKAMEAPGARSVCRSEEKAAHSLGQSAATRCMKGRKLLAERVPARAAAHSSMLRSTATSPTARATSPLTSACIACQWWIPAIKKLMHATAVPANCPSYSCVSVLALRPHHTLVM